MNKSKVTMCKGSKTKTDNDAAEVFVLPPNLLEQLGINLRNIETAPESAKESPITDINIISKEKEKNVNCDIPAHSQNYVSTSAEIQSSIIETAELMKASVFLSPTFISNNTSNIQGEIEIIGNTECGIINQEVNVALVNKNSNKKTAGLAQTSVLDVYKAIRSPIPLSIQENKECNKAASANVKIRDIDMQTLKDDHADEAYSSDCSNSNTGCSDKSDFNKKFMQNKINIISEQIILPSQIYNFESGFSSQVNTLVHVSTDTVIKGRVKDSSHHQNIMNMQVIPNLTEDRGSTKRFVSEGTYTYEENCTNESIDTSPLDSEILQNIHKIDTCTNLNETECVLMTIPYNQENPRKDNVILQMSQKSDLTVNNGKKQWYAEAMEVSKLMNMRMNEVGNGTNPERCSEHYEDEGIDTSKVLTTDSCVGGNHGFRSMFNITSHESKADVEENDVTIIEYVSDDENGSKNIKNSRLDNVISGVSEKKVTILQEKVIVDSNTMQWDVDAGNVSKNINKRTNEIGNETNTERCNEHNDKIINIYSCVDRAEAVSAMLNNSSSESKSEIVQDNLNILPYVTNIENENKTVKNVSMGKIHHPSTRDLKSNVGNISYYKDTLNLKPVVRPPNINELNITEQKSNKQFLEIHNGNTVEEDIFLMKGQHTLNKEFSTGEDSCLKTRSTAAIKKNCLRNEGKGNTTHKKQREQCTLDKNTQAIHSIKESQSITSSPSLILKAGNDKNKERESQESDDNNCNQKEIIKSSEISGIKRNSNEKAHCGNNNEKLDPVNKDSNILDDKVREIAQYLSKIADLKKRSNRNAEQNLVDSQTFSNKKHAIYSKSIHGVEKPGGSGIDNEMTKKYPPINTYERRRRQRCTTAPSYASKESETYDQSINLRDISSCNTMDNEMEFCICYDFGRLVSYDNENCYEHIHFWDNTKTDCTSDLIFSMYSEDTPADTLAKNIKSVKYEYHNEKSVTAVRKLCWNEMKFIAESKVEDVDDLNLNVNRHQYAETYGQKRDENIASSVKWENVENKCNEIYETENEATCKNQMFNVNLLQNGETTNNNMNGHEYFEQTGKRRKSSKIPSDIDEPLAKKRTSKPLLADFVQQSSTSLNKATRIEQQQSIAPVDECISNPTDQSFTNPVRSVVQPSKIVHDVPIYIEHPETPLKPVTISQALSLVNECKSLSCGVCQLSVEGADWIKHIASQHNYLAWKHGEPSLDLDDDAAVRDHLSQIAKSCGGLECMKCGLTRKHVKAYLSHIRRCSKLNECSSESVSGVKNEELCVKNDEALVKKELIKCGVCEESIQSMAWNDHNASRHNYLAWKFGEPYLDVNNEEAVREHLYEITKANGGLTCAKCGLTRKYVRAYMSHIRSCSGLNESQNDCTYNNDELRVIPKEKSRRVNSNASENAAPPSTDLIKCGVCEESIEMKYWNEHRASRHDYLAWILGDSPLDLNDEDAVREHLYMISKTCGGLTCAKCGLTRKYVKAYLSHIQTCNGLTESQDDNAYNTSSDVALVKELVVLPNSVSDLIQEEQVASINNVLVECGVCKEILQNKDWHSHIASRHDYMAWKLGEPTLDVNDEEAVLEHLNNITKAGGTLTCSKCGLTRKYVKAYLSHFKNCEVLYDAKDSLVPVDVTPESSANVVQGKTPTAAPELVKCGVCGQYMESSDWPQHLATQHEYLAWRDGDPPININDEEATRVHLQNLVKKIGALSCPKCGSRRKYVKSYLHHLRICGDEQDLKDDDHEANVSEIAETSSFTCGVCNQIVESAVWSKHLSQVHNYLAWKDGDTPLDLDDADEVYGHLYNYTKEFGCLICKHCGKSRKYVKPYLEHIKTCNQHVSVKSEEPAIDASKLSLSTTNLDFDDSVVDFSSAGTCAVCHKEVGAGQWIQHTQKEHNYLAWREGEKPWDLDDFADVNQYLYGISKRMEGLTCNKCGLIRKYVRTFLTHIKTCSAMVKVEPNVGEGVGPVANKETYQCAMCKEIITAAKWKTHANEIHYNVTWIVGQTPLDIKNPYVVERYLKEYKQVYGKLKCRTCDTTRASFSGFYAHVITCGKTEEEIDMFKEECEICNNKYLCIYRNQHAMAHKVQNYTAELKLKKEALKSVEAVPLDTSGKRRAAVKARSVIENYSNNMSKHLHTCQCGYGTDFKEELEKHKCQASNVKDFSGDDSSAAETGSSDDDSSESDVDSNISNEVNDDTEDDEEDEPQQPKKRLRYRETAVHSKAARMPFTVENPASYIKQGDLDFCNTHLTDDVLFPLWRRELEAVSEADLPRYLPPLEQSCKVKSDSGWTILDRFEARKDKNGICAFMGASIVCIAWAPFRIEHISTGSLNFLAIACHNGADCPRYQGDETLKHENMIQIWNFSTFKQLPELSFGIAHELGTVWSMDWCPSGARDPIPADSEVSTARLGLLAAACSSGSAYIFAVPYPATVEKNDKLIHILKPVAELRMTMGSDRKQYQATSVSWSKQKGHNIVLVGYADGSTAYYDLHTTSPLLRTMETDVQVFYPYHDERAHNTCITGTDLYPAAGLEGGVGAGACASAAPTGALLTARAGAGAGAGAGGAAARARLHVAAGGVLFAPHAPHALLAGDDAIMHTSRSELVWAGGGRRLGAARAAAGCARCGRVAAAMPPTLRVMRPHPAYSDPKKTVVGMLEMTHLAKKRKQVNDELTIAIEPLTYADAISKYGIEFHKISKIDRATQQHYAAKPKSKYPDRFPLADVKSMAFCPSRKHHDRLAVATHSGILFLITLD